MSSSEKINFYDSKLNIHQVIDEQNLKDSDEALYVCDLKRLKEKYELWIKEMPRVKPYYAVKCNDEPGVLKTLAELGTNFDCASKSEIKQILDLGIRSERIIFAHPTKMIPHIKYAKENGIMTTTVDTECEIYKIHKYYPECNLVIRFRCDAKNALSLLGNKFGCDPENEAPKLMELAKKLNLKVVGASFHVGSGCNELPVYDRAITLAKEIFRRGSEMGFNMHLLDIGGGFPGTDEKAFKEISKIVNDSLSLNFPDDSVKVIAEPGRFFVASAFTLICKIHSKKETKDPHGNGLIKHYYLNDGVFCSFIYVITEPAYTEVHHLLNEEKSVLPRFKSCLWGPTCDSADKIIENIQLPDLECEDFLIFPNMGAYSLPLACRFNGFNLQRVVYYNKRNK
ncbi:ornithine decarboxylase 2-like [Haematobia irritans]|uniref:ornithine decarboxylase 2-like n=1 Tax=Haematobia irritans TaxID=7368 RepID=UPI003F4F5843